MYFAYFTDIAASYAAFVACAIFPTWFASPMTSGEKPFFLSSSTIVASGLEPSDSTTRSQAISVLFFVSTFSVTILSVYTSQSFSPVIIFVPAFLSFGRISSLCCIHVPGAISFAISTTVTLHPFSQSA